MWLNVPNVAKCAKWVSKWVSNGCPWARFVTQLGVSMGSIRDPIGCVQWVCPMGVCPMGVSNGCPMGPSMGVQWVHPWVSNGSIQWSRVSIQWSRVSIQWSRGPVFPWSSILVPCSRGRQSWSRGRPSWSRGPVVVYRGPVVVVPWSSGGGTVVGTRAYAYTGPLRVYTWVFPTIPTGTPPPSRLHGQAGPRIHGAVPPRKSAHQARS